MSEVEVFDSLRYRIVVDSYGTRCYYNGDNQLHRVGDAAVEYATGEKRWYQYGRLHRTDGNAVDCPNGHKEWWQNSQLHRTGGPAIEAVDGYKAWYINGERLTEAEFNQRVKKCLNKRFSMH